MENLTLINSENLHTDALSVIEEGPEGPFDLVGLSSYGNIALRGSSEGQEIDLVVDPDCMDFADSPKEINYNNRKQHPKPTRNRLLLQDKGTVQIRMEGVSSHGLPYSLKAVLSLGLVRTIVFSCLSCLVAGVHGAALDYKHSEIVKKVGKEAQFSLGCPLNLECDVHLDDVMEGRDKKIYDGKEHKILPGYLIDDDLNLNFLANKTTAGNYCVIAFGRNKCERTVQVIVLLTDTVCDINVNPVINGAIENNELWAWCTVTYIGKGIPQMKWTFDGTRNVTPNATVNSTGAVSTFTSTINMQVNSSANGMIISCKTTFELCELTKRPRLNQSLNYEYIWNHAVNVPYRLSETKKILIGVGVGGVLSITTVAIYFWLKKKKSVGTDAELGALQSSESTATENSY